MATVEVRAAVRIRPPVRSGGPPLSIRGQYGQFAYDYVVEEGATQEQVFSDAILPQVNNFLQGYSSVVLAYGAGQTGKTFTLEGGLPSTRTEGAIPRAMHAICKNLAAVPKHRYKLYVTYCALSAGVEAQMVDLLAPGTPAVGLKDGSATTALARLLHYQVHEHEDIYEVLRQGRLTRATAFTSAPSSGSPIAGSAAAAGRLSRPITSAAHLMLNIQLTGFASSGEQLATNLTFVELAAPEAKDMLGYPAAADGALTRSLSLSYASLTAVISALKAGAGSGRAESPEPRRGHSQQHIPWRDSPLTRWLKGCLGGAASVLVLACVAPGPEAAADTLATLSYVNRLRSGPKSDGLIVTATWDTADGSAPGFDAMAAQAELHHSMSRQQQQPRTAGSYRPSGQRDEQSERERFGSPIQVRSPADSASRPQSTSRYNPPSQRAPSIDTMGSYHTQPTAGTDARRSSSVPRSSAALHAPPSVSGTSASGAGGLGGYAGGHPGTSGASVRSTTTAATPLSSVPASSYRTGPSGRAANPSEHSAAASQPAPLQPLRTSDVLPPSGRASVHSAAPSGAGRDAAREPSVRSQAPASATSRHSSFVSQQRPAEAEERASQPSGNNRPESIEDLLASLQTGGSRAGPPSHTSHSQAPSHSHYSSHQQAAPSQSQRAGSTTSGPAPTAPAPAPPSASHRSDRRTDAHSGGSALGREPSAGTAPFSEAAGGGYEDAGAHRSAYSLASTGGASGVVAGNPALQGMLDAMSRQVEQLRAELGAERRESQLLRAELSRLEETARVTSSAAELSSRQAVSAQSELRSQIDVLRRQLEAAEGAKQSLARRVQQLQDQQGNVLDLQAESSVLEAQARALQDSLDAARANGSGLAAQLAEAKAAGEAARRAADGLRCELDEVRGERDRLQRQNSELSDKLQAQVRSLSDETARLRSQVIEATGQIEAEQMARKAAEAALGQVRVHIESSRGAEGAALQQSAALSAQARELGAALEAVRNERNKLQEGKWRSDERAEQLALELDAAVTQRAKMEMEARAAATKAEADLRSAITAAEGLKMELKSARGQVDSYKQELRAAQLAAEDAARRESGARSDTQDMEALMRELDRDLEVQANALWRQLRSERADALLGAPDSGQLGPARRWRPVLQALVGVIKRNVVEAERQGQALELARKRMAELEPQAARAAELSTTLSAQQQVRGAQLAELDESRRSIALLDGALGEANRECQRLHRQLEELSAAHKALSAESSAREAKLQHLAADREAALQNELSDLEARLQATTAELEKRTRALADEWEGRLQAACAERDARMRNALMDAEDKLRSAVAEREARLASVVAEADARLREVVAERDAKIREVVADREARLSAVIADKDARLAQTVSEGEARLRDLQAEREAKVAALSAERDALQRQLASLSALQAEDKQERDALRLKAQSRDQLLSVVWSEMRAAKAACTATSGSASPSPLHGAPSPPHSHSSHSPSAFGPGGGFGEMEVDSRDWSDHATQDRLLKGVTTVRVQVNKLLAELGALRGSSALSEDLSGQLVVARTKLAEVQRHCEVLQGRVASLEEQLRGEQAARSEHQREDSHARSSLQQQLAAAEASSASTQAALAEARATIASLHDEVAQLAKSRDTWKDTATQQEGQLRELFAEAEARAAELSRLRVEAQASTADVSGAAARIKMLESQLQDAQGQVETLNARLSATDKALSDANTRAASLNGQLVLSDSEQRLKAQELLARVQAAEDGEKMAKANAKEVSERLESRLAEVAEQSARLVAELDGLRAERNEAQIKADELHRQLLEARARLADADHTSKQLHKVVAERDGLQEAVNGLRNANSTANDDVRSLRRQLDSAQEQLARLTEEKNRLAAQIEGQRLEAIMAGMVPRTGGRISALAGGGGVGAGTGGGAGGGLGMGGAAAQGGAARGVSAPGAAGDGQRSYARAYTSSLTFPAGAANYDTPARSMGTYGSLGMPYTTPIGSVAGAGSAGGGVGYGGVEDSVTGVRVHVRTSPGQEGQ